MQKDITAQSRFNEPGIKLLCINFDRAASNRETGSMFSEFTPFTFSYFYFGRKESTRHNRIEQLSLFCPHFSKDPKPRVRAHFERQSRRLALIRWVDHCRERRRRRWCSPAEDIKRRIMDLWKTLKISRGLFRRGEVVNARSSALLKAEIIRPSEPTANHLHRRVNPHDSGDLTPVLQLSS